MNCRAGPRLNRVEPARGDVRVKECGDEAFKITDTAPFRYPHYHEATDTPDKLDFDSMARVAKGNFGMVRELAAH